MTTRLTISDDITMRLNREQWGAIIDGLIRERAHAGVRKSANSESTSDIRADMCADLIAQINEAARHLP